MYGNPQFPADLVTVTEELLNGKLHFLCSVSFNFDIAYSRRFWENLKVCKTKRMYE